MPNQLLQKLQNLLSNQSNTINLISSEFDSIEITEEQNQKFENIFLVLSISLVTILGLLTYYNYQNNYELAQKDSTLIELISESRKISLTKEELNNRISKLELYKKINSEKIRVAEYFDFVAKITDFLKDDNIVNFKYSQKGKVISYEFVVNTTRNSLEQDLNSFLKTTFTNKEVTKINQITIENSNLTQYKFAGIYELK
jgi:hypothetical protein